ncbi:hypothetical protein ANCCAN_25288 [Ancylostoma caninum]|uniref:Uncharacterized protein n=1 Tax=Ancylostoma caninum TaxID=29170 RepID=A0A368FDL4_ANCCA|nr:hypothetical protein ANCCAN_25288 [Ancylostoma caninum]
MLTLFHARTIDFKSPLMLFQYFRPPTTIATRRRILLSFHILIYALLKANQRENVLVWVRQGQCAILIDPMCSPVFFESELMLNGTPVTIKNRQLKATQSAPSKRALKSSRSHNDSMERRFSDSDYDLPLAHFAGASNDVSRRNGVRSSVKRKRGRRSSADGDYKGSDTEVPLSEIRRRYRSIRWADKLKRRRIDYTGMDWDE